MYFIGLGTAVPETRYTQRECWNALQSSVQLSQLAPRSLAILKKVLLGDNGIATRSLALNPLSQAFELDPDVLHRRFATHAPALATEAATRALQSAGCAPETLDAILISTCTGYLCPGLTSYVAERLGLRADVLALDLVGQGCGAALPNLRTSAELVRGGCGRALSICVEVCSAAFYLDNDPGVLISACLFGDGAAAAVLSGAPMAGRRRVQWRSAESVSSPSDRDYLRFEQRGGMLRNILTQQVPALAGKHAELVLSRALANSDLQKDRIAEWILHAGGREILLALRDRLGLRDADLRWSAAVLRDHGNMSSPCVLFALQNAIEGNGQGGLWWMSSFGAGFSCHGALLEVE
jgi:alkylresorcinol/alkylpyrone synthase